MNKSSNRNNFSLFIKICSFLLICYLTTFVYIKYFKIYYNREQNTRWHYLNQVLEKEIDISDTTVKYLFLGESRLNAGIDFLQIPNCWSMAYGGTTPIEQYYILNKYLEKYSKPDTIIYSVSPRFLKETFSFWDYAVRNDFFTNADFNKIIEINNKSKDTLLNIFPKCKYKLYKLNYIGYYQADIYKNKVFFGKKSNLQNVEWMQNNRGQQFHPNLKDSCSELNYETKYENFEASLLLDFYFDKIFELANQNDIHLIFLFMPMNKSSFLHLNPQFIADYKEYIRKYQKKYSSFDISDTLYYYEDFFFGDNSHLNSKGKLKFTNWLHEKYVF